MLLKKPNTLNYPILFWNIAKFFQIVFRYLKHLDRLLNLTLKMYKSAFSDKQIIEIKKKMHIDPIFTYSDSEIALKVCRNKQRFKFNRRLLCT